MKSSTTCQYLPTKSKHVEDVAEGTAAATSSLDLIRALLSALVVLPSFVGI